MLCIHFRTCVFRHCVYSTTLLPVAMRRCSTLPTSSVLNDGCLALRLTSTQLIHSLSSPSAMVCAAVLVGTAFSYRYLSYFRFKIMPSTASCYFCYCLLYFCVVVLQANDWLWWRSKLPLSRSVVLTYANRCKRPTSNFYSAKVQAWGHRLNAAYFYLRCIVTQPYCQVHCNEYCVIYDSCWSLLTWNQCLAWNWSPIWEPYSHLVPMYPSSMWTAPKHWRPRHDLSTWQLT